MDCSEAEEAAWERAWGVTVPPVLPQHKIHMRDLRR